MSFHEGGIGSRQMLADVHNQQHMDGTARQGYLALAALTTSISKNKNGNNYTIILLTVRGILATTMIVSSRKD